MFEELSPTEFVGLRLDGEHWQLLDVREPWEVAVASVADSIHIPLAQLGRESGRLVQAKPVAVLCHSGVRSARAAEILINKGFSRVANLSGGIDTWSVTVDDSIPRY